MQKIVAPVGGRIAKIIADEGNLPYATVRKLLRAKDVKLNGKRVGQDVVCSAGDILEVYTPKPKLNVIYSDENVALLNKPVGISCEAFFSQVKQIFSTAVAVHRLDTNTSGLLIYALNQAAEEQLLVGFKNRWFTKLYLAEVKGVPNPKAAVITAYLKKNSQTGIVSVKAAPQIDYLEIKTGYEVLRTDGKTSLLKVELFTGRTHQIRAHLAYVGHPIVGDGKYGDGEFNRRMGAKVQRLKAYSLTLNFKEGVLKYLDGKTFVLPENENSKGEGKE